MSHPFFSPMHRALHFPLQPPTASARRLVPCATPVLGRRELDLRDASVLCCFSRSQFPPHSGFSTLWDLVLYKGLVGFGKPIKQFLERESWSLKLGTQVVSSMKVTFYPSALEMLTCTVQCSWHFCSLPFLLLLPVFNQI